MKVFPFTKIRLKGFTLAETMAGITIVLLMLGLTGISAGRAIQNSKLDKTELILRAAVSDLDNYVSGKGSLDMLEDEEFSQMAERFVSEFNNGYSSITYDAGSLNTADHSFSVEAQVTQDAWGNRLILFYSWTNDMFIVASAGPNMKFEFLTEKDSIGLDDLLAVAVRKHAEE